MPSQLFSSPLAPSSPDTALPPDDCMHVRAVPWVAGPSPALWSPDPHGPTSPLLTDSTPLPVAQDVESERAFVARLHTYGTIAVARSLLFIIGLFALVAVAAQAIGLHEDFKTKAGLARLTSTWVIVTLGCSLPWLLMYCLKVLTVGALSSRALFTLPREPPSGDAQRTEDPHWRDAIRLWQHDLEQFERRSERHAQHVTFYGILCTLVLSAASVLVMARMNAGAGASLGGVGAVGVAVGAAASTGFLIDVGRILVRAANRDASPRMFAWATRRFLLVIVGTSLLSCLILLGKQGAELPGVETSWLLIGAGMAFLGDRAAMAVGDRVASVLGVPPRRRTDDSDLSQLDGIADDEIARLAEEGIASLHALAFASTPTLFLSTHYPLQQICDWQDQCLLLLRLGPAKAALCREQLLLRGATDAQRLARDFLSGKLSPNDKEDVLRMFGLSSELQANIALQKLADDPLPMRINIYRQAAPESTPVDEQEKKRRGRR